MEEETKQKWIDNEFIVTIEKKKGKENTSQTYICDKMSLMVVIATMTETILRNKMLTPKEFSSALQMAVDKLKGEK